MKYYLLSYDYENDDDYIIITANEKAEKYNYDMLKGEVLEGWNNAIEFYYTKDDGGHLIASIFKGSGDIDNLVPMDATLNRGDWRTMESTWAKALDKGKSVDVKIEPIYSGDSMRPISFEVEFKIEGESWIFREFTN